MGKAWKAITAAGLLCGAMDIAAAFLVYGRFGARPMPLLQGIAAGLLGRDAFRGGWPTAALGLFLHFVIAFGAAIVFFVASRWLRFLLDHWLLWGALYGVAVYFFMQLVVVPLSRAVHRPFNLQMTAIGIAIHIVCVGWPIAGMTRKLAR